MHNYYNRVIIVNTWNKNKLLTIYKLSRSQIDKLMNEWMNEWMNELIN